jgi:hypothetical protein
VSQRSDHSLYEVLSEKHAGDPIVARVTGQLQVNLTSSKGLSSEPML